MFDLSLRNVSIAVVATAAVGGIAYYLLKRDNAAADTGAPAPQPEPTVEPTTSTTQE